MLITLAVWLSVGLAAWGYGRCIVPAADADGRAHRENPGIVLLAGLLAQATLLTSVAIFTNVQWWMGLLVVLPGIALSAPSWGGLRRSLPTARTLAFLAALSVLASFVSAREVTFYDTALYHQQLVKWMSEYGLVPGLAFLHNRFGLMSSWYGIAAVLNHGPISGRQVATIGGMPFALILITIIRRPINLRDGAWVALCGLVAFVGFCWNLETSLSADLLSWLLPMAAILAVTNASASASDRFGSAILIASLGCGIKPTAVPVLVYTCVLPFFSRQTLKWPRLAIYLVASVLILSVAMFAEVRVSGCPFYPVDVACITTSSGPGSSAAMAKELTLEIRNFAIGRELGVENFLMLLVAAIGSFLAVTCAGRPALIIHGLVLSSFGIAFVLLLAPNPRFGMGYFLLPVALGIGALVRRVQLRERLQPAAVPKPAKIALISAGLAAAIIVFTATDTPFLPRRMAAVEGDPIRLLNRRINTESALHLVWDRTGTLGFLHPESSDQCWDADLPCTPTPSAGVELSDPARGLRGGFRISKKH